jgi:tripartite-type tricarboxylate transporter receptor subunit TctC
VITRRTALALGALAAAAPASAQQAGSWRPERPLRIVVPFAAGGSTDVTTRLVAEQLAQRVGQGVVVENRAGAGGNIGVEHAARAAPDGYTLVMGTSSTHAGSPALYRSLPFDPARDFAPVVLVSYVPNVLVVPATLPVRSLQDFVAYARANSGRLSYGSAGSGSSHHLSASLLAVRTGTEMTHVPYRGGAPAMTDLLSGRLQFMISPIIEAIPHIRAEKLRPLGVTTPDRMPLLPDVPAIGEVLPGYRMATWLGLFAPAATPATVTHTIAAAVDAIMREPAVRARMLELGSVPLGGTPAEFARFFAQEMPEWAELVRISGASVE